MPVSLIIFNQQFTYEVLRDFLKSPRVLSENFVRVSSDVTFRFPSKISPGLLKNFTKKSHSGDISEKMTGEIFEEIFGKFLYIF